MIEIFKTNVQDRTQANNVMREIHKTFEGYEVNFDLEDCDRILRVKSSSGCIEIILLIELLSASGCIAEVLQDELR